MTTNASTLIARIRDGNERECPALFRVLIALGVGARVVELDTLALVTRAEARKSFGARALLAAMGNEDADVHLRTLIERAASGKGDERSVAKAYLRDLDATLVVPALLRVLTTHKRANVRATAASIASGTAELRGAFPVDALIDAGVGDDDEKVRIAALTAAVQHFAPAPPAKPVAKMTPARRAKLESIASSTVAKSVAALAQKILAKSTS